LFEQLGVPDYGDILDKMYPKKIFGKPGKPGYDPNRTIPEPEPKPPAQPAAPAVHPPAPGEPQPAAVAPAPTKAAEALIQLNSALEKIKEKRNASRE
jgi:hypothetical protein